MLPSWMIMGGLLLGMGNLLQVDNLLANQLLRHVEVRLVKVWLIEIRLVEVHWIGVKVHWTYHQGNRLLLRLWLLLQLSRCFLAIVETLYSTLRELLFQFSFLLELGKHAVLKSPLCGYFHLSFFCVIRSTLHLFSS